jgi:putative membrane protein
VTQSVDAPSTPEPPVVLHRLHPLSPLLRGWKAFTALAAYGIADAAPRILSGDLEGRRPASVLIAGGFFGVALLGAAAYGVLSWRFTRYAIHAGDLRIDTGVLFRQSRRVRLDRVQAVDVVRPLLARALGLAELRLEVAGGSKTEAPLAYLSEEDAHRLRAELLARAAGLGESTPEAPERLMYVVPDGRLLAANLLQIPVVLALLLGAVFAAAAVFAEPVGAPFVLIPAVGSVALTFGRQFAANQGFTLAESPDGLRIRRGLLETRAQTVPPGRIQAVRLIEPVLWRLTTGWARLEVEVAGYTAAGDNAASAVLLPVAARADCVALMERVLPGANVAGTALTGVPRRARWLDPVAGRVLAAGGDERYFVTRRGALRRETDVMPHERVQSVRAHQGPLQRLLRLASVTLDTTPGPITVSAEHRDAGEALQLVERQARLARTARARAVAEQWMRASDRGDAAVDGTSAGLGDGQ